MPLSRLLAFLNFTLVPLLAAIAGAQEWAIQFRSDPAPELLRPFGEAARFSLSVSDGVGKPLPRGEISLVMEAPAPSSFLSTDFPLIEGTRLLEIQLPLIDGRAEWRQVLPIRGVYRLSVDAGTADGRVGKHKFELSVAESREKWLWLGLFCAALFVLGFVAGRIFTRPRGPQALLLIAFALTCARSAAAHEAEKAGHEGSHSGAIAVEPATVGKPALIRWRSFPGDSEPKLLSLAIIHLEKTKTVFAFEKLPVTKEFSFAFHFPDGAQYLIQASAETSGGGRDSAEQKISVTGVEPTLGVQLPSLLFFLAVIALGLGAGRLSKRWRGSF